MKKKLTLLLMIITGCCAVASAQARKGLRINEVMVVNENNFVDDYGQRGAWVELFNSNFLRWRFRVCFSPMTLLAPRFIPCLLAMSIPASPSGSI